MESDVLHIHTCRICFSNNEKGVFIFSEEGKKLYLQAKIRKYLYITVSMDDKSPTRICDNCCKRIEGIHKFATMAVKNQEKFTKLLTDTNSDIKKSENKGLLHTYLTKGTLEKQIDDTVEVEVKVDPMLFLHFNSEDEETDEEDENLSDLMKDSGENTNIIKQETINKDKSDFKNFRCPICPRAYQTELALQNHEWSHFPKKCSVLNNSNKSFCKYEKCVEEHHDVDISNVEKNTSDNDDGELGENGICGKFSCPICGKIISTKGNLKVHLETHRPKGKYGCDICGRIFKTQCNLHRHKEYHSGIQFTCTVCGRVYPTNSTLRAHSITHSDLRPHKCPLCDKTFKRNQDLKFHINQHTGARPYQCPYCPKAFASSGNCFSHRKRMHPFEVERDRERAAKIMR